MGASVLVSRVFWGQGLQTDENFREYRPDFLPCCQPGAGRNRAPSGRPDHGGFEYPENIMEDAVTYLNIYFMGLPFLLCTMWLSAMFNALGKSRIPLYLLIFSSVFNVALDLIMVCSFHMGGGRCGHGLPLLPREFLRLWPF